MPVFVLSEVVHFAQVLPIASQLGFLFLCPCVCVCGFLEGFFFLVLFFGILAVFALAAADVFGIVSRKREGGNSSENKATKGELELFFGGRSRSLSERLWDSIMIYDTPLPHWLPLQIS